MGMDILYVIPSQQPMGSFVTNHGGFVVAINVSWRWLGSTLAANPCLDWGLQWQLSYPQLIRGAFC